MDFFGRQAAAKRSTGRLVGLFALAVLGIAFAVYVLALIVFRYGEQRAAGIQGGSFFWHPQTLAIAVGATLLVVLCGTTYKLLALSAGGPAVARMLGGRRVEPGTADLAERTLYNVVEEMAIASGLPMPEVYVLEAEESINAFAAGLSPRDAVVAVTRGTLDALNREELQGVIGHEFSHVLNGDMRLNVRLIGVLFGITCLATAGYILLRSTSRTGTRSSRKGGGAVGILAFGAGLWLIGSLGSFCARMIQAAVSRQREFLADAASVQFTRNPQGLAHALQKIRGNKEGLRKARMHSPHAGEASHLFISDPQNDLFASLLATHPPLEARIAALLPGQREEPAAPPAARTVAPAGAASEEVPGLAPAAFVASIGTLAGADLPAAGRWLDGLALEVRVALHDAFAVRGLILALVLAPERDVRAQQLASVQQALGAPLAHEVVVLAGHLRTLPRTARLPLVELALPALRSMSPEQHATFRRVLAQLVEADATVSIFEFALQHLLARHLDRHYGARELPRERKPFAAYREPANLLLSAIAHTSAGGKDAAGAFARGAARLPQLQAPWQLLPPGASSLDAVGKALAAFARAEAAHRRTLLTAAAEAAAADGVIEHPEHELLRALAEALDCPVPPLALPLPD